VRHRRRIAPLALAVFITENGAAFFDPPMAEGGRV
jgi:hypothetical protein